MNCSIATKTHNHIPCIASITTTTPPPMLSRMVLGSVALKHSRAHIWCLICIPQWIESNEKNLSIANPTHTLLLVSLVVYLW